MMRIKSLDCEAKKDTRNMIFLSLHLHFCISLMKNQQTKKKLLTVNCVVKFVVSSELNFFFVKFRKFCCCFINLSFTQNTQNVRDVILNCSLFICVHFQPKKIINRTNKFINKSTKVQRFFGDFNSPGIICKINSEKGKYLTAVHNVGRYPVEEF